MRAGARLGPYEIAAKLGEGGMGEVWRASDPRLDREVAIKVLPAALAEDAERLARFEREAKLLAQLHHPNIAAIFGLEESEGGAGARALVMELVEGEDLSARIARGALPLEEALPIAQQIAEALEAAHERGIVHRDLKPQNVKLTADGTVKVLDFGLAKALDPAAGPPTSASPLASPALMNSPTLTRAGLEGTQLGVILGTAAYMAPEQARGAAVDKRTDIWAFGVLLYEMLTGEALFAESSVVDTLSAVMRKQIDLARLPATTPRRLRELVRRCLERDPRNRLRDIGEARFVLQELRQGRGGADAAEPPAPRSRMATRILAAALALAALAAAAWLGRRTAAPVAPAAAAGGGDLGFHRFTHLTWQAGLESSPSLSPDGELVAYSAIDGGDRDLFLLRVDGQRAINLTEDSPVDEDHAAFSPDGRRIAFRSERAGGGLFVMGATGESVRRLTDFGDNPSWSPDGGEIVFATEGLSDPHAREKTSELWVVAASGGSPRRIYAGDAVEPAWSPGGHRIAFWRISDAGIRDVWTVAADGSDPRPVTDAPSVDWSPAWAGGTHLWFASDRGGVMNPWRVAIDEATGRPRGEPEPITLPAAWSGEISLSGDGRRLVYRSSTMTAEVRRLPFDAAAGRITGPAERLFDTAIPAVGLDVSRDGAMIFRTASGQEDVYVVGADGSGLRKLTDDVAKDRHPVWSPDGSQAAFYSARSGRYEVWTVDRDGANLRQRSEATGSGIDASLVYPIWSPDGRSFAASLGGGIVRFPVADRPVPVSRMTVVPVAREEGTRVIPMSWSPDGRRLGGTKTGRNGELLPGVVVVDLAAGDAAAATRFIAFDLPVPATRHAFPNLAWLPDSRRGIVRWGEHILLVDAVTAAVTTLATGFDRHGGTLRVSADGRALYMLDPRDEGDLWLASREAAPAPGGAANGADGASR
jgi:Tol biopolymer transport system component